MAHREWTGKYKHKASATRPVTHGAELGAVHSAPRGAARPARAALHTPVQVLVVDHEQDQLTPLPRREGVHFMGHTDAFDPTLLAWHVLGRQSSPRGLTSRTGGGGERGGALCACVL